MNAYTIIKLVALVSMIIDHLGIVAGFSWMRIIGRLAFPIFAFLMGYGTRITKHEGKRVIKLGITAAISLPLTIIAFDKIEMNIMVQFFFFSLVMWLLRKIKFTDEKWKTITEVTSIIWLSLFATIFNFDYKWLAPVLCYISYKFDDMIVLFLSYAILIFAYPYLTYGFNGKLSVNSLGVVALPLILWFLIKKENLTGRKIYKLKIATWFSRNFFYIMYPLHIAVLLLLKNIFNW